MVPLSKENLPLNYYIYQPEGSPTLRYSGVSPTGPLPESVDFPLVKRKESDRFKALICGDPQPRNLTEVNYLAQSVVPHLAGTDAMFGVSLGDIAFNDLTTLEPLNQAMGLLGIPWHNVVGNHDLNFDAASDQFATETFRRVYGPTYYSFDCGPVHFLVLKNVEMIARKGEQGGSTYHRQLGKRQLEFIRNDLTLVPKNRLVVLLFHIPLDPGFDPDAANRPHTQDRQELYRIIENRPHTLSFSAHTHNHNHLFLGAADGWNGAKPHHHVNTGTLCGSWFAGAPDVRGIPHGTMSDGTPRGYLEVAFDGNSYNIDGYRVLQKSRDHQMNIIVPTEINRAQLGESSLYVNVFNGSARSKVQLRFGAGDSWRDLQQVHEPDPSFSRLSEHDRALPAPYHRLPVPIKCSHLWRGSLPVDLPTGTHAVEVLATDMFGNQHREMRPVRVVG